MKRRRHAAIFLLAAVIPAACDEGGHPPIGPDKLPPLSAEDLQTIRAEDARIEAEERGTPVLPVKKSKATAKPAPAAD
ncbi:hypothetical protein [Paludisphaera soli]|uniref:hypothetical protein n=1 Tax=Paludisphaera soli TaxID=2712865 RepID=UPI0013ECCCC9|nr:hypothetical protein [Paludisphaera soli]